MTDTVEQKTLAQFIAEHHITMVATRVPARSDNAAGRDKDWDAAAYHYCCVLRSDTPNDKKTTMTVYFSMGSGHVEKKPYEKLTFGERSGFGGMRRVDWENCPAPGHFYQGRVTLAQEQWQKQIYRPKLPTVADVLDSLAMDASSIENSRDFEEWADDGGYDKDSRKAEATYNECKRQTRELELFLGRKHVQELLLLERQ